MLKGLKFKFFLIIVCLSVFWLAFAVYLGVYHKRAMEAEEAKDKAGRTAAALASAFAQDMQAADYSRFGAAIEGVKAGDGAVAYIKVRDAAGAGIIETGGAGAGVLGVARDVKAGGTVLGSVTVGLRPANMAARDYLSWFPVTAILALLSLYVLVFFFNRMVLEPIGRMNGILKTMAQGGGDLTQRLKADTDDEIGEMARNMNVFLGRLQDLVVKARESSFSVLELTRTIMTRSKGLIESSNDQAVSTNENFKALERINVTVQDVAGSAESLSITSTDSSAAVTEMATQVDNVADNTIDLSGHVEEASLSINEMNNSIKEVAENVKALAGLTSQTAGAIGRIEGAIKEVETKAKESAALSNEVSKDADTLGNQAIARTIEGMERIRDSVDEASKVIENLGARSVEIGQIIKVIDEVTNQTSLLALNAAILASQAGEHGKGFEVVANEIKDLAERTSSSTGEISKLIKAVQHESKAAVESMRQGRERVLEGTKIAYGAAEALSVMLGSSIRSRDTATGIEKATTQQVQAVRQLSDAIRNVHERIRSIEKATQEQSKGSELIKSAAEKMNNISREVRRAMAEQAKGIKDFARNLDETREMAGMIAGATKSQSDDSSELVKSMERFLEMAQDNAAVSREMEEALQKLLRQAEALRDEMARFKV